MARQLVQVERAATQHQTTGRWDQHSEAEGDSKRWPVDAAIQDRGPEADH